MRNSTIKSKKNHKSTRHMKWGSCKIWGHLDVRKHVNKNWENAYHSCSTKCNTSLQKKHITQTTNEKSTNFIPKWRWMSLVSPQKISESLDTSSSFHKRIGKRYKMCIHVKNPKAIKNPANQKIIKNHDKKVGIHVNMMQKFSWILELKRVRNDF